MKKIIAAVVLFSTLVGTSVPISAEPYSEMAASSTSNVGIMPLWENITRITPVIDLNSSEYRCAISAPTTTTKLSITMVLYELRSGVWVEVSRKTDSANTNSKTFSNTYSYTRGKTYKLSITLYATKGGITETITDEVQLTY